MKKLLLGLLLLVSASRAVDTLSIPTDFNTVTSGTRANLSGNFTAIGTWAGKVRDTVAQVTSRIGGYTGTLLISSLSDLRLKLDADNNETARLLVEGGAGDSLLRVQEGGAARLFNSLTVDSALTVGKALTFTNTTSAVAGSIWKSATGGLELRGVAGSTWDFVIVGPGLAGILGVPTGTNNVQIPVGSLTVQGSVTGASFSSAGNGTFDSLIAPKFYEENTFTGTLQGCSSGGTATFRYIRIGKQVTLIFPSSLTCTSVSNSGLIQGLPATITPARAVSVTGAYSVQDASTNFTESAAYGAEYLAVLTTAGNIQLYRNGSVNFSSSGTKGFVTISVPASPASFSYSYTLQ